jgi:hypothetical protein
LINQNPPELLEDRFVRTTIMLQFKEAITGCKLPKLERCPGSVPSKALRIVLR